MNHNYLYDKLESFYVIRGDEYAKEYLTDFIKTIIDVGINVEDVSGWYEKNKRKWSKGAKSENYENVLNSYIQYLSLSSFLDREMQSKKTTKIHDSFHDFKNSL